MIDECIAAKPAITPAWLAGGLLMLGQPEKAMDFMERGNADDEVQLFTRFWSPVGLAARRSPRFAGSARAIGMAELWERYGPADGCDRAAPREYACDWRRVMVRYSQGCCAERRVSGSAIIRLQRQFDAMPGYTWAAHRGIA